MQESLLHLREFYVDFRYFYQAVDQHPRSNEEQQETVHAILATQAQAYVKSHNLSTAELVSVGALIEFLEKAYHVALMAINEEAERHLMPEDIRRKLNVETVRLKTTTEEGNFMEMSGTF